MKETIVDTEEKCPRCGQHWIARWHVEEGAVAPEPGTYPFLCPLCEKELKEEPKEEQDA